MAAHYLPSERQILHRHAPTLYALLNALYLDESTNFALYVIDVVNNQINIFLIK